MIEEMKSARNLKIVIVFALVALVGAVTVSKAISNLAYQNVNYEEKAKW